MNELGNTTQCRMRMGRTWLRLVVLLVIISLAIVASVPAAAAPLKKWTWPSCNWQCQANDVQVQRAWLGSSQTDPELKVPTSCTPGESLTAYLWVSMFNSTGTNRYGCGVVADVVVGDKTSKNQVGCVMGMIGPGETKAVMLFGPFDWLCGEQVSLQNVIVYWDTKAGKECTADCTDRAMGQCEAIARWDIVVPCDLEVSVTPAEAFLSCEVSEVELEVEVEGAKEYSCSWYRGDTYLGDGSTHIANTAGVYRAEVTAGSCTASASAVVGYDESMPRVWVEPATAQLPCPSGEVTLTALVSMPNGLRALMQARYDLQWYGDGEPILGETGDELVVSQPGLYQVRLTYGECVVWSNVVLVTGCEEEPTPTPTLPSPTPTPTLPSPTPTPTLPPPCVRADVSAIIYGGWDGIAVNASVGGSAQPTKYTTADSAGHAAVLWTFYPPEGKSWSVLVAPQLPAGLDPERWKYEPASKLVTIKRCSEQQVTFQLVDTGPKVEVILPVTGGQPTWWQGFVRWLRGLLGR